MKSKKCLDLDGVLKKEMKNKQNKKKTTNNPYHELCNKPDFKVLRNLEQLFIWLKY